MMCGIPLAFYLAYQHKPHFIVLLHHDVPVGLLPLWYDNEKQSYDWFGSYWHEHNNFWVTEAKFLPALLQAIPAKTILRAVNPTEIGKISSILPSHLELKLDEPTFAHDLTAINNHDDYLRTQKKKMRYN